jgi:hypothetical protein
MLEIRSKKMSERVIAFVEEWVSNNVHAEGYPAEGEDAQAKALAQQCRAEALEAGIPASEIDDEFDDLAVLCRHKLKRQTIEK